MEGATGLRPGLAEHPKFQDSAMDLGGNGGGEVDRPADLGASASLSNPGPSVLLEELDQVPESASESEWGREGESSLRMAMDPPGSADESAHFATLTRMRAVVAISMPLEYPACPVARLWPPRDPLKEGDTISLVAATPSRQRATPPSEARSAPRSQPTPVDEPDGGASTPASTHPSATQMVLEAEGYAPAFNVPAGEASALHPASSPPPSRIPSVLPSRPSALGLESLLQQNGLSYPDFLAYLRTPDMWLCFCEFVVRAPNCPLVAKADAVRMLRKIAYATPAANTSVGAAAATTADGHRGWRGSIRLAVSTNTTAGPPSHPSGPTPRDVVANAQFLLAACYQTGRIGLFVDLHKAFLLYTMAAKLDHAEGMYRRAACMELGAGTRKDMATAVAVYERAALLGSTQAMLRLGMLLLYKRNSSLDNAGLLRPNSSWVPPSPEDVREGITWLGRAATRSDVQQHPVVLYELGLICEGMDAKVLPLAVEPNPAYALDLFFQAARFGYAPAQYKLGGIYEAGALGLVVDMPRALAWYVKAAEQGNADAQMALSGWYLCGLDGVLAPCDLSAFLWAQKAAEQGNAQAEYAVGYFWEHGIGLHAASVDMAKKYYLRASAKGNQKAIARLHAWAREKSVVKRELQDHRKRAHKCLLM